MIRLIVLCPEALIPDANHLAMVLGEGAHDAATYRQPAWQDSQGHRYALASFQARPEWIAAAQAPLTRPAWDTSEAIDMAAATRAQSLVIMALDATDEAPASADPTRIVALAGAEAEVALGLLGLTRVSSASDAE
jgi:hypothetical protein